MKWRWSRGSARSVTSCTPGAAATNWWPRIFACSSRTRRKESQGVAALIAALAGLAERQGVPMAGMTHLQHAQPLLFSHFLLAHAEAFFRDLERLASRGAWQTPVRWVRARSAVARFPWIARRWRGSWASRASRPTASMPSGDRDFALDYLYALAGLSTHLSHLAEDFVLFASQEFGFVLLPDEYSTGSSLMPQKKNPDAWELLRGKTGRITGALMSLLVTLKGLPSSYQRDLQEDKEPVFAAHDQALAMVRIAAGAVAATRINETRFSRRRGSGAAGDGGGALSGSPRHALPPGARSCRPDGS